MRRWILPWTLLLLALPLHAQDSREANAVSQAWDRYAELSSQNDPRGVDVLAASTLRHFGFLRDAALYASAEQLRRAPLPDRVVVLALRATQSADALKALDAAAVGRLCIEKGYFGVPAPAKDASLPGISHATLLDANHAVAELAPPNGPQYNFGSEFFRENGQWKVAPESMVIDQSQSLQQQARSAGIKDDVMAGRLLAYLLDSPQQMPNLIALEQPLLDDAMARARLSEAWPDYEATYKARVAALAVKAEAGDSSAQYSLGMLLVGGNLPKAAPKDEPRGWKLLEQASDGGNTEAAWFVFQHLMSQMKQYDEAQLAKAASHLQRAAAASNPQAMAALGSFYFEGAGGLAQDCRQAATWLARAEEAGLEGVRNEIVWTWATCPIAAQRDPAKALQLVDFMVRQQDTLSSGALDTVAAAYAANQQFDKAVSFQQQALAKLAKEEIDEKLRKTRLKRMQARLRDYQSGRDYVQDYNTFKEITAGNY